MDLSNLFANRKAPASPPPAAPAELDKLFSQARRSKDDEWARIIDVPRVSPEDDVDPKDVEWLHCGTERLRPLQMLALAVIQKHKSLYGSIGVGQGKSLIARLAGVVTGVERYVILMPPDLIKPYEQDIERFKSHFRQPKNEPILISYNQLSSTKESDILERLRPQLIVADEGHTLANDSARTRRLRRYFHKYPETELVLLSGTLEREQMSDLAHLVHYTLRDRAFMPTSGSALETWAQCVDLKGKPNESHWRAFQPLAKAEGLCLEDTRGRERTSIARDSVYLRMASTPGVILTTEAASDVPLRAELIQSIKLPQELTDMIHRLRTGEETPDGEDIITDDAQRSRLQRNLSMGFFYRWAWEEVGGRDEEWLVKRRAWSRAVRKELEKHAREFYDSEKLVYDATARELLADPSLAFKSLRHLSFVEWREQQIKLKPPTKAVWVTDAVFEWLEQWLKDKPPTLVWYSSSAIEERLAKMGLPVFGKGSLPPTVVQHSAMQIQVHHKGKNLQAWHSNLVLEPFSKPDRNQQLIGRTKRPGQKASSIYIGYLAHTKPLDAVIDSALEKADHVQTLSRSPQYMLSADWSIS